MMKWQGRINDVLERASRVGGMRFSQKWVSLHLCFNDICWSFVCNKLWPIFIMWKENVKVSTINFCDGVGLIVPFLNMAPRRTNVYQVVFKKVILMGYVTFLLKILQHLVIQHARQLMVNVSLCGGYGQNRIITTLKCLCPVEVSDALQNRWGASIGCSWWAYGPEGHASKEILKTV